VILRKEEHLKLPTDDGIKQFDWAKLFGVVVTSLLIFCVALVGLRGWVWFKDFVWGPAAGWVQALGSIGAIIVGFVYADVANAHQRARDADATSQIRKRQLLAVVAASMQADEVGSWINISDLFNGKVDGRAVQSAAEEALITFKSLNYLDIPDEHLLVASGVVRKDLVSVLIHCKAGEADPKVFETEWLTSFLPTFTRNLEAVRSRARVLLAEL
jgi:hypothetical protein